MTIMDEFKSRNFSIYGQWTGVLCIILCLAVGIANFFHIFRPAIIIFAIICVVSGLLIIFIEIPLLLRICPTSPKFDAFMQRFSTNYLRAAFYLALSIAQWLSLLVESSSLLAAAVFLLLASIFYALAGLRGHEFAGSKTLGGHGVAQMIV